MIGVSRRQRDDWCWQKPERAGHTHGLRTEPRGPGKDLAGGQVLYELGGEVHGIRLHGDAALRCEGVEPGVQAVVAEAVELPHEPAEGGFAQACVAVEVEDGGGLVDEVHLGGGHAGHQRLHVGGDRGGVLVQWLVERGGQSGVV